MAEGSSSSSENATSSTNNDVFHSVLEMYCRFSLEDVEEMKRSSKGKGTSPSDADLALQLFAEDASTLLTSLNDRMLAMSLQNALEADQGCLDEFEGIESQDYQDHLFALALSGGASPKAPAVPGPSFSGGPKSQNVDDPTSTLDLDTSKSYSSRRPEDCVACGDRIKARAIQAPCGHFYDSECLLSLFTACMSDESLFPPRCCRQEIPVDAVRLYMGLSRLSLYETKASEFGTRDRLYCSNKSCSRFLGPRSQEQTNIRCPTCRFLTCSACSEAGHARAIPCNTDNDEASQLVLALGQEQGWQRCPGCRRMVELNIGCYHMTCLCKSEFCYLCAATWKTCSCRQWDDQRLLAVAEQRVERQNEARNVQVAPVEFRRLVDVAAEQLRTNHDCAHQSWAYRRGGGQCENCHHNLRDYLMRCTGCQMHLCRRCRYNRV